MINSLETPERKTKLETPEPKQLQNMLTEINYDGEKTEMKASEICLYRTELDKIWKKISNKIFEQNIEFSESREEEVETTLQELLLNSFSACGEKENLKVNFTIYLGKEGLVIHISDDGPGFDYEKKLEIAKLNPNGLTRDKILNHRHDDDFPGGAGMFCLLNFTQDFQFNKKGNKLIAKFNYEQ